MYTLVPLVAWVYGKGKRVNGSMDNHIKLHEAKFSPHATYSNPNPYYEFFPQANSGLILKFVSPVKILVCEGVPRVRLAPGLVQHPFSLIPLAPVERRRVLEPGT